MQMVRHCSLLGEGEKPEAPSDNQSMAITLWDVKEPTNYSQRVRYRVPGDAVWSLYYIMVCVEQMLGDLDTSKIRG